jgi:hypothetical protein
MSPGISPGNPTSSGLNHASPLARLSHFRSSDKRVAFDHSSAQSNPGAPADASLCHELSKRIANLVLVSIGLEINQLHANHRAVVSSHVYTRNREGSPCIQSQSGNNS